MTANNANKKQGKITKKIVVIYHKDCSDGFGGAWAAWKHFGNKADYVAVGPSSAPVSGLKDKEIYLIDVSYKPKEIIKLLKVNKRVTGIDHHLTGEQATKMTYQYSYAVNHSGAGLAWKYFYPQKPIPKLLAYVEDGDLWRFKLPHTKEIRSYLELFDFDFNLWSKLAAQLENLVSRQKAIEQGSAILRYENKLVERLVSNNSELVKFEGYKALAVNSPNFASYMGNILTKIQPPLGIVWNERKGEIKVSLRSDGSVDVSKIAKKYGGGGHKAAAGFSFLVGKKLPWKIIK